MRVPGARLDKAVALEEDGAKEKTGVKEKNKGGERFLPIRVRAEPQAQIGSGTNRLHGKPVACLVEC